MKICPRCKHELPLDAFAQDRSRADGRQCWCRSCRKLIRPSRAAEAARQRRYRQDPTARARHQEGCRRAREKNRDAYNAQMRQKRLDTPGYAYAALKKWRSKNPDKVLALNNNRRARELAAAGSFTAEEWASKCAEYHNKCAYCRQATKLTVQHVIPLSRNGPNDISNIVPACQSCNSKIGTNIVVPQPW